jgi:hypothetical protein
MRKRQPRLCAAKLVVTHGRPQVGKMDSLNFVQVQEFTGISCATQLMRIKQ